MALNCSGQTSKHSLGKESLEITFPMPQYQAFIDPVAWTLVFSLPAYTNATYVKDIYYMNSDFLNKPFRLE